MNQDWVVPVALHMLNGLSVTLWVSLLTTLLATAIGLFIGGLSASTSRWVQLGVRLYIDIFRGVPSLITLLFVFFALPHIGVTTGPITASVLGLAVWGGANIAETARGALKSISARQTEAARALGLGKLQALVFAVMPQAIRRFLPPYIGQLTVLIQASALTSVVGVADLLGAARQMIERLAYVSPEPYAVPIYMGVLLLFFLICYPLTLLASYLERKLRS
ncbi:amino acid ABC transporter permease [Paracidovorax cattleyae]|uniref:Amino acid ABC transporter membrane protein 2, PAAT family n=1 Tax=Paracidovorax cattleyae TaxID=80868 RepID=A0A1H0MD44_9BURK|nr:amino acid ABC transporter permease [Paracidovorax cattleyae]MBF9264075.1 amino acid ABC transporter permease [Paracidovorax cattleyae]SDO78251.1 amino acid ABC transporter membrane protein 2, PAAT family [Paracidovorax cattleyae]